MNIKYVNRFKEGFTLVEMLLVLAVVSILMGLLAPAIFKSFRVAGRQGRQAEAALLQAAIVEYWHDQKRWPLPTNVKPQRKGGKVNFSFSFRENNYEVFDRLLNVDYGGAKKNYIETSEHLSTSVPTTDYPTFDVANLKHVIEGNSKAGVTARRNSRTLVYWADWIRCPKCGELSDLDAVYCSNNSCSYKKDSAGGGSSYRFKSADRSGAVRAAMPFVVRFDLLNDKVSVGF
ncbi:MAG: type II secretion system protein [Lentisphaerae bacterium]|jgi:prepilin-type N-terminal cleavage/methylation domain-containing protein|nr:type II secretion system protein [Lentisphaerota bacterium]